MKFALVFSTLIVFTIGATIPEPNEFIPITTYRNALKTDQSHGTRITNGQVATQNQFPYQVSVVSPVGAGYLICGGSIISADWVLTACHCITQKQFNLRFGSLNLWAGGTSLTSFTAIKHPNYNSVTLNNDLALIKLPRALGFGPSINSIRLPRASQQDSSFEGLRSTVSGFGATSSFDPGVSSVLRYVDMRIMPNQKCQDVYGTGAIVDHVVCALGWTNEFNQGHCGGDSGGPFVMQEGNDRTLIGVVSFAAAVGCDRGYPSGYMRTGHFVNWVRQHTKIAVRP